MDRAAAIANAVALLESVGQTPSIRRVAEVIAAATRQHGKKDGRAIRWTEIAATLKVLPGNTSGNTPAHPGNDSEHNGQHPGNTPATPTRARGSQGKSKIVPIVQDGLFTIPLTNVNGKAPKKTRPTTPKPDWTANLLAQFHGLLPSSLASLDELDRIVVARYFAMAYGGHRKNEPTAAHVKSALNSLVAFIDVLRRERRSITVKRFDAAAEKYHAEVMGGKPWYTSLDLRAFLLSPAGR